MIDKTAAKTLALYFFEKKGWKFTVTEIRKQIINAKYLLGLGFTEEEIRYGIDYYTTINPPRGGMYSLGLLNSTLNKLLEQRKSEPQSYNTLNITTGDNDESTDNNRRKFNNQPRFGEKYTGNLFKKAGEDD